MRIKNIKLHNFLSYKDIDLQFLDSCNDEPTIYIIDGINLDAGEDSKNGIGKSVLTSEAVMYNLYGKAIRGSKKQISLNNMVKYGADKMSNEIEYFINSDEGDCELTILRTKELDSISQTAVSIDGIEKTKRTKRLSDKDIRTFIDLEPEVFSQVILYYKDSPNLLTLNNGQRLDFFKTIIDLSIIDEYFAAIKDFKINNEKKMFTLETNRKSVKEILDIVSTDSSKFNDFIIEQIDKYTKELKKYTDTPEKTTSELEKVKTILSNKIKTTRNSLNTVTGNIAYENSCAGKIKTETEKMRSLSNIMCPTCKQIVSIEHTSAIIDKYSEEIDDVAQNLNALNIEKIEFERRIKNDTEDLDIIINEINEINTSEIFRKNKISTLKNEISKLTKDLNKQNTTDDTIDKKEFYEKKFIGYDRALNLTHEWQKIIEYWYNTFSPKSLLRNTIIKKYIAILSDIFEYYLSTLYQEIVGKIDIDEDSQIEIMLFKDGYETSYYQLSSGEKKRIDVALMLALYEFTTHLNPNIPKFLILDEIFDSCDVPGRIAMMETLIDVQKRHLVDIFLISHIEIPEDVIPENTNIKYIQITKKDKCSTASIT